MFGEIRARSERQAAQDLNRRVDRLLAGTAQRVARDPLLETAQRLSQLDALLPPVPGALERRVADLVYAGAAPPATFWRRVRPVFAGALMATVILMALWTVTPGGQSAWAQVLSSLSLGQIRVEVTPTSAPADAQETPSVREALPDLLAVELAMGRAPAWPRSLPDGYALRTIYAVTYPDLPAWISQPFFFELCYGTPADDSVFCIKEYRLLFREYGGISKLRFAGEATIEQVDVSGVEGALLTMPGDVVRYMVVWERDGLLLELSSDRLAQEALLDMAQMVR